MEQAAKTVEAPTIAPSDNDRYRAYVANLGANIEELSKTIERMTSLIVRLTLSLTEALSSHVPRSELVKKLDDYTDEMEKLGII